MLPREMTVVGTSLDGPGREGYIAALGAPSAGDATLEESSAQNSYGIWVVSAKSLLFGGGPGAAVRYGWACVRNRRRAPEGPLRLSGSMIALMIFASP